MIIQLQYFQYEYLDFNIIVIMKRSLENSISEQSYEKKTLKRSLESYDLLLDQYNLNTADLAQLEKIDSGNFGTVHRCPNLDKVVKITFNHNKSATETEIALLKRLSHQNIITLEAVCESPWLNTAYVLIINRANCNLEQYLEKTDYLFPNSKLSRQIGYEIMEAVKYLHSNGIAHMDLKIQNILMFMDQPQLCDFGSSLLSARKDIPSAAYGTTVRPPEICRSHKMYPCKVDVWSLAVLLIDLFAWRVNERKQWERQLQQGELLFSRHNYRMFFSIWLESKTFTNISEELPPLLSQMLTKKPDHRCDIYQVEASPFWNWIRDQSFRNQKSRKPLLSGKSCPNTSVSLLEKLDQGISWSSIYQEQEYLNDEDSSLNPQMYWVLVKWIAEVCLDLKITPLAFQVCSRLIQETVKRMYVSRFLLQCVGTACLRLSNAFCMRLKVSYEDLAFYTDHTYTIKEIKHVKRIIIKNLSFDLISPVPEMVPRKADDTRDFLATVLLLARLWVPGADITPGTLVEVVNDLEKAPNNRDTVKEIRNFSQQHPDLINTLCKLYSVERPSILRGNRTI